jgi:hypothetical protein
LHSSEENWPDERLNAALDRSWQVRYHGPPFHCRRGIFICTQVVYMKRSSWLVPVFGAFSLMGCVDRRYVVTTDPPGAVVLRNNQPLGPSPVDDHFVYYGTYNFTIIKEGYETLQVQQEIPPPWYQYPPLDFFSENIVPYPIVDVRRFHFKLEPRRIPNTEQLLNEAQNLRNRGISVGGGSAVVAPAAVPPGAVPAAPPGALPAPGVAPAAPALPPAAPPALPPPPQNLVPPQGAPDLPR